MLLKFNKTYTIYAISIFLIEVWIALLLKDGFIRHTVGDFLVVILLYCGLKAVINIRPFTAFMIVLIIAFTIEGLQAVNLLQLLDWQNNTLAQLILGTTFSVSDLVAYTLGGITVLCIEHYTDNP